MTRRMTFGRILSFLALFSVLGPALPVLAQQAPSQAQLEAFRSLPPEQQRAILEQMSRGTGTQADQRLDFPVTTQPRDTLSDRERELLLERERVPTLRAGDLVVLDVALRAAGEDDFTIEPAEPEPTSTPAAEATTGESRPATPKPRPPGAGLSDVQRELLETIRTTLLDANPYRLDRNGSIVLPGVATIALAGLTEPQATKRLASEPALRGLRLRVTLLPVERQGADALKPFGYDMFRGVPTTFAPVSDVPVPGEYVLGPGDTLQVQLLGSSKGDYTLVVGRNGEVRLPELGPVAVAGLRFSEARREIEETVAERMIGTRAVVGMGELKSITIFVTGEAEQPGSYTVSSLSTITNALFATGGVKEIGSLRNVQLKRRGQLVATLDLYDLLLKGDTRNDLRLSAGDVIFIPPVGTTVGVTGEIRRPAIYELRGETRVADVLYLAGGLTPEADPHVATLERVGTQRARSVVDLDLTTPAGRGTALRAGDLLHLHPVRPDLGNAVGLNGHVQRPGPVGWRQGLWLTDVLPGADALRARGDLNYVLVRREDASRRVSVVSADLERAWRAPRGQDDLLLAPRDQVYVFDLEGGREHTLKPILDDLRRQGQLGAPTRIVGVGGRVRAAGPYPLEPGMRVSDLIRAGGGLGEAAYGSLAELTRYEIVNGESRRTGLVEIDLARVVAGDPAADLLLQPFDYLVIKELPQWSDQETVTVDGEVRFPGTYPIKRGETLLSVIGRAGGLTDLAFAEGSVFTRESLKVREARQIEALAQRLQSDLASLALQATQAGPQAGGQSATQAVAVGQTLLQGLRETQPVGRLVIDLDAILGSAQGSERDLVLRNGDRLIVPPRAQEVTVLGEVQSSTSHVWSPELRRDDYVRLSGGMTQKADDRRVYVVRANGSVTSGSGSRWFGNGDQQIRPGDTIVVPLDAERMRPLPLWTAVTTIIYNLAVAVAAVNSF